MKNQLKLNRFVKKCCIIAENARYPATELYLSYVNWCLNHGVTVYDQFYFLEMLEQEGFNYNHQPGHSFFEGISVLPRYRIE